MKKALYLLDTFEDIYGGEPNEAISGLVEVLGAPLTGALLESHLDLLVDTEIILGGWGTPPIDETFLKAAPKLEAVFYGSGSIREIVTDAFWKRDILICSAWTANAIPVAQYTVSQVLFCLKRGYRCLQRFRETRGTQAGQAEAAVSPGSYRSVVGIIGLGSIGRLVAQWLRPFGLEVLACDPCVAPEQAGNLGLTLVSLDEIFRRSDVVSLHAPWLRETEGMVTGPLFESMKPHASFINTSRGALVREDEMIAALRARPDLTAVLDVTWPEPPGPVSPLWDLPNVVLTPHIAGSTGRERRRMGQYMVEELQRYLNREPLKWRITREQLKTMA